MAATGVRARIRGTSTTTRWLVVGVLGAGLLVAGFVGYEEHRYAAGYEYGERTEIITTHVFDGERPEEVTDHARYEGLAEQECAEHGAADGVTDDSPKWTEGCVDAVLRRR